MWVIYFSNMIQFVMLWKVNFFNKTNGLTIAPVYIHMTKIQFVSKGLRVYHWLYISRKVEFVFFFEMFQILKYFKVSFSIPSALSQKNMISFRMNSRFIKRISSIYYYWIFNQSYFQPCSFFFLSGPSGVFMSPWLSPCSRICPLLFVPTVSHGKKSFHYTTSI